MLFSSVSLNSRNIRMLGLAVAAGLAAVGSIGLAPAQADITKGLYGQWLTRPASSSGTYANTAPSASNYGTNNDTLKLVGSGNTTWHSSGGPGNGGWLQLEKTKSSPGYLQTTAVTKLQQTGAYTVSGWVNFNNYGNAGSSHEIFNARFGKAGGTGGIDIQFQDNSSSSPYPMDPVGLHGDIGGTDGVWDTNRADVACTFTPGKWYMVTYAVTGDASGGSVDIYVNGKSKAAVHWTISPSDTSCIPALLEMGDPANPSAFEIGGPSPYGVSAGVADFRIYNRQLSRGEVLSLYKSSTGAISEPAHAGAAGRGRAGSTAGHAPKNGLISPG